MNLQSEKSFVINYYHVDHIPYIEVVSKTQNQKETDVIIGYHGWTNVKEAILIQAIEFAEQGFTVILPDAHLHGQRKPADHTYNPFTDLPDTLVQSLDDFEILRDHIHDRYTVKSLSIFGTSMGGMMVSLLISKYANDLSGAVQYISTVDISNIFDSSAGRKFKEIQEDRLADGDNSVKIPENKLETIKKYNLIDNWQQLENLPFYSYNGGKDDWIDSSVNQKLIPDMESRLNQPIIKYEFYEHEDHWVPFDIIQNSASFLKDQLSNN